MMKDPGKMIRLMWIVCIVIGFLALGVGVMAVAMKQWIIAVAMGIVAVIQILNYRQWKKRVK